MKVNLKVFKVSWEDLHVQGGQDVITVAGYPIEGDTISLSYGVLSCMEIPSYVHGATEILGLQTDVAINSQNFGFPIIGVEWQKMEKPDLCMAMGMKQDKKGVRIRRIETTVVEIEVVFHGIGPHHAPPVPKKMSLRGKKFFSPQLFDKLSLWDVFQPFDRGKKGNKWEIISL